MTETMKQRLQALRKEGFVKLLEISFLMTDCYNKQDKYLNYLFAFWHPTFNVLAIFDTYGKKQHINRDTLYYQRKCTKETRYQFHASASGPLFDKDISEIGNLKGDALVAWYESRVIVGAVEEDSFWSFIHNIRPWSQKQSLQEYLIPWAGIPFLWLIHHADDDHLDHTQWQEKSVLYDILNQNRLSQIKAALWKKFQIELSDLRI